MNTSSDPLVPDPAGQTRTNSAKRGPKFKAHAARIQVKRRHGRVLDTLTDKERAFLRERLIRLNHKYCDVAEEFAATFSRRLSVSTLQRFFAAETRPAAATHDEIIFDFQVRVSVPKGTAIRVHVPEVTPG